MPNENPEIQIWIAECDTQVMRDEIVERCKKIEGCTVLFVGTNDEGKYVVIKASTGKALTVPAVEFYGHKNYPEGPRIEMLAGFSVTSIVKVVQS